MKSKLNTKICMKKIFIMILVAPFYLSAVNAIALESSDSKLTNVVMDISDLKTAETIVPFGTKDVLYVFDIDDTLLTSQQEFGSDYWFNWQMNRNNSSPVPCVLDIAAITTEEKSLLTTQEDAPQIFNNISQAKILLTSRNAATARGASIRELKNNGYHLPEMLVESKVGYIFNLPEKGLPASYFDGIYMVTGQNKGESLLYLFDNIIKQPKKYTTVVLIDDGESNIKKMQASMISRGINYYGLHYIHVDKPVEVSKTTQKKWKSEWKKFLTGLEVVSKQRAENIKASKCLYN